MSSSDLFMLQMLRVQNKLYWFERSVTSNSEFRFAGHMADWSIQQIIDILVSVKQGKVEVTAIGSHEIMTVDKFGRVDHWKQMPPRLEDVASIKALRR